jgi:hypothetical protein
VDRRDRDRRVPDGQPRSQRARRLPRAVRQRRDPPETVPGHPRKNSGSIRDRCYDFQNIFAKKLANKIAVFGSKQSKIKKKKLIITLVFQKKRQFFSPKIVENRKKL